MPRGRKKVVSRKRPPETVRKSVMMWHNEMIDKFARDKENIDQYRADCETIQKDIALLEADPEREDVTDAGREIRKTIFHMRERLSKLRDKIHGVETGTEETEYMTKAWPLLMRYEELRAEEAKADAEAEAEAGADTEADTDSYVDDEIVSNFSTMIDKKSDLEINRVVNDYLKIVDPDHIDIFQDEYDHPMLEQEFCQSCETRQSITDTQGNIICTQCGLVVGTSVLDLANFSFKQSQEMSKATQYKYEKITHFRDKLAQVQGKETATVPPEDLEIIRKEVERYKIGNIKTINKEFIRHILKKCKLNKKKNYNEHAAHIIKLLGGKKPDQMTPEMEQTLESMFLRTLPPFEKYKPPNRKNYNTYEYTIFKLCQLKGWDRFLRHLKLPKSKDILQKHDKVWRKICDELGWEFIDSIGS